MSALFVLALCVFGYMTLVTYILVYAKSILVLLTLSLYLPHTMSMQQVRPFGLGGFGVFSSYFSQFNLELFREDLLYEHEWC